MPDQAAVSAHYFELLKDLNFDTSYYNYALSLLSRADSPNLTPAAWSDVLNQMGLSFSFNSTERFFEIEPQVVGDCRLGLLLAMTNETLEPILSVETKDHKFGGPFQILAYKTGRLRDPDFAPEPLYPTLFYLNKEQLQEAISFSLRLFDQIKERILAQHGCQ